MFNAHYFIRTHTHIQMLYMIMIIEIHINFYVRFIRNVFCEKNILYKGTFPVLIITSGYI